MVSKGLRLPVIAVIGALIGGLFVIACGSDATSTPRPTTAPSAPAPTVAPAPTAVPAATPTTIPFFEFVTPTPVPKPPSGPQGTLTIAVPAVSPSLGIPFFYGPPGDLFVGFALEGLLNRDLNNNTEPGLAEKWELGVDSGKLTFFLRKGVEFHKGWGEATAEDVEWSIENVRQPGTSHRRGNEFIQVERFDIPNPYQIDFVAPPSRFFIMLDSLNTSLSIHAPITSKKHVEAVGIDDAAQDWVGFGSWSQRETRVAEFIAYDAVEDHYRKTPEFKELFVRAIPEPSAALAAVRTGEVDIVFVEGDFISEARASEPQGAEGHRRWLVLAGAVRPVPAFQGPSR